MGNPYYSFAIDYWSLGVIAFELIYGKHMFPGTSEIDMLFKIFQRKGTPQYSEILYIEDYKYMDTNFQVKFPRFRPIDLPITKYGPLP